MGCVSSVCKELFEPINLTAQHTEIIGSTAPASLRDVRFEDIPMERVSMAAVELEASTKTIYYRIRPRFERENSLDFDEPLRRGLRSLLNEPVGRFYLMEYALAKKLVAFEARVSFMSFVVKLRDEILHEKNLEKPDPTTESDEERDARIVLWLRNLLDNHILNPEARLALVRFCTDPTEADRLKLAVDTCQPLGPRLVPGSGASKNELMDIRNQVVNALGPLFRSVLRVTVDSGAFAEFKSHSEYKRYKNKMSQVYNNINHDDFDFMATLGKGSFGRVVRVRKRTTGQQYAMKIMSKKKILSGAENAAQVTIERNVLVMCNSPFVVKVHFAFHTTRALFLCMDLLEGGTLASAMPLAGGAFPLAVVQFHTAQMILGLEHLHDHGILFRDLKPLNVMLDRQGNAVLTDMGLACKFRPSRIKPNDDVSDPGHSATAPVQSERRDSIPILPKEKLKCVGTYGFRAPELLNCEHERNGYGPAIDYWALGVTVYFLLTAKMPFKSRQQSILEAREKPKDTERRLQKQPIRIVADLDPVAVDLVKGLLDPDPNKRLGDADLPALKAHQFFRAIDWARLARRELTSPFKPGVPKHPPDEVPQFESVHAAMAQFTHDNVLEMFGGENEIKEEYTHVNRQDQKLFKSWDYIPEAALETEWGIAEKARESAPWPRRKTPAALKANGPNPQPE